MTGSLQIKNNTYYAVLNMRNKSGKRQMKWFSTGLPVRGNKREATAFLNQLIQKYENANITVSPSILFADFMLTWLDTVRSSIEANTYESYKDIIGRYVLPYFQNNRVKLQKLEPMHIQKLYNQYIDKGLSSTTVLKIHANIRKALQHAVKMNLIPYNPADRVEKPKKQKYHASFYSEEQINDLLDKLKDEPMYPAVLLAVFYGLRRSEVLGLKWQFVNLKAETITICNTVVEYDTVIEKMRTKTASSTRTLPLIPAIADYLRELKLQQTKDRLFFGNTYVPNDFVCKRKDGSPFRPNYLSERFNKLIRRHGLPKIRFHDLRHSAATMLLANGFSLKEIQEWLGHGDIATTSNIYAHVQYKAKKSMAESMGASIKIG